MTLDTALASGTPLVIIPVDVTTADSALSRLVDITDNWPEVLPGVVLVCPTRRLAKHMRTNAGPGPTCVVAPNSQTVVAAAFKRGAPVVIVSHPTICWKYNLPSTMLNSKQVQAAGVTTAAEADGVTACTHLMVLVNRPEVVAAIGPKGLCSTAVVGILPHSVVAPSFEAGVDNPGCLAYRMV